MHGYHENYVVIGSGLSLMSNINRVAVTRKYLMTRNTLDR